jgi:hypothetical protein
LQAIRLGAGRRPIVPGRVQKPGSWASRAFSTDDAACNQVRRAQGLRQLAVACVPAKYGSRRVHGDARALNEQSTDFFDGACALDKMPFARASPHPCQQRAPDRRKIRPPSHDHHDRAREHCGQPVDVHYVEARECDSLQQDRMELGVEARLPDAGGQPYSRVHAVAADAAGEYAIESVARIDGPNDQHVAAMIGQKRRVVESNRVRPVPKSVPHAVRTSPPETRWY